MVLIEETLAAPTPGAALLLGRRPRAPSPRCEGAFFLSKVGVKDAMELLRCSFDVKKCSKSGARAFDGARNTAPAMFVNLLTL
jgi:hypothetical protein